jgi:iron complex transport system ATP-binding protein
MLLREGTVVAAGLLGETLTADNLTKTFGVPLVVQRMGDRYTARAA